MRALSVQQAVERTGLSEHTLRYYERAGLIPRVHRAGNSHRRYTELDIEWIEFVARLRATGMAIADVRRYTELVLAGPHTADERAELLEAHRRRMLEQIEQLQEHLAIVERKIGGYREFHDERLRSAARANGDDRFAGS